MKPLLLAACLLAASLLDAPACAASTPGAAADPQALARREIAAVIEAFRTAIIDKDKPKFLALFKASGRWRGRA